MRDYITELRRSADVSKYAHFSTKILAKNSEVWNDVNKPIKTATMKKILFFAMLVGALTLQSCDALYYMSVGVEYGDPYYDPYYYTYPAPVVGPDGLEYSPANPTVRRVYYPYYYYYRDSYRYDDYYRRYRCRRYPYRYRR